VTTVKTILALAASAAVLLTSLASPAAAAVPETVIKPGALERGEDVTIPHLEGKTLVDGDVRVPFKSGQVRLLGPSGADYVVGTSNKSGGGNYRVLRVTAEGDRTVLLRDLSIWELVLSQDGLQIAANRYFTGDDPETRVRVYDAQTGDRQASRRFRGYVDVLDGDESRLVLGATTPSRTFSWHTGNDGTQRISRRFGYAADIRADRLATFTGDPYQNGCSVVSTLGAAGDPLWKSCKERVASFAPKGSRMATIHILSDGLGPRDVWLRRAGGKLLAHYSTHWFGQIRWESDKSLLLDANGKNKSATVRCRLAECERASALKPAPNL
jgi:hypothetical protein